MLYPLTPGTVCVDATTLPDAVLGAGSIDLSTDNWWRLSVQAGETYRIEFPTLGHVFGLQVFEGDDCATMGLRVNTAIDSLSPPEDVVALVDDFFFIRVFIVIANTAPMSYTIRVTKL